MLPGISSQMTNMELEEQYSVLQKHGLAHPTHTGLAQMLSVTVPTWEQGAYHFSKTCRVSEAACLQTSNSTQSTLSTNGH